MHPNSNEAQYALDKRYIVGAIVCLVFANAVPAFWLAGDEVFGWMATWLAFLASIQFELERGQQAAAILGVIANIGYLATICAGLADWRKLAKRTALIAVISAFGSVVLLLTGSESFMPGPGCLVWLATGVILVLSTTTRSVQMPSEAPDSG